MQEIWKDVHGYEGYYQVSNLGNVKSLTRTIQRVHNGTGDLNLNGRLLSQRTTGNRYKSVILSKFGTKKGKLVHRLVAEAFIPIPSNYPIVNHKDENKSNNNVFNLEWCDNVYNSNYGTVGDKISVAKSTPVIQYSLNGDIVNVYRNARVAAQLNNFNHNCIYKCCYNKLHSYMGYVWRFKNDDFSYNPSPEISPVIKINENNHVVKKYNSIRDAIRSEHISYKVIKRCISDGTPYKGFYWGLI